MTSGSSFTATTPLAAAIAIATVTSAIAGGSLVIVQCRTCRDDFVAE